MAIVCVLMATARLPASDSPTSTTMRLITCAPNLAEMVFALGAGDLVVGVSRYTDFPPEAAALPQVVDLFNVNEEAVLRLRPTHLIGVPSSRGALKFFESRKDIEVVFTGEIETLDDIDAALLFLGGFLGAEERAQELVGARPQPRAVPDGMRPRVLVVVGRSGGGLAQLYAAGQGTYLHELLLLAGGDNAVPEELGKYPVLNKEALLRYNPEIIVEFCAPDQVAERREAALRAWSALPTLEAVRRRDFRFLTDEGMMKPGPRAAGFKRAFEELLWGTAAPEVSGP